jgi:endonuclease-8
MPEGPEIRLAADRVARVVQGQVIEEVKLELPALRRFEKRLVGRNVSAVDTHGKAMLTRFDNGLTLYTHNQLYGRWYTTRRSKLPDTTRQLRVALHTDTGSALLYSASDIHVLTERQLAHHPFLSRLGPDILNRSLTAGDIAERMTTARFVGRSLGSLYLDQGFLAGNGNYLRSEILWAAHVSPGSKPRDLTASAIKRLARETIRIARRSYRTRGVTVPDRLARELRAAGESYESYRFQVYGREGLPCRKCSAPTERAQVAGRSVFYCPSCQRS